MIPKGEEDSRCCCCEPAHPAPIDNDNDDDDPLPQKELHVAPMVGVTYSEFRFLLRLLTKRAVLWTEMIVDDTIKYTDSLEQHLAIESVEHPVVCQLGGRSPDYTREAVRLIVEDYGYDEVNLNAGCPSSGALGKRRFGATLMKDVDVAVQMLQAMKMSARDIPVSIKTRIAVDDQEGWETFLLPYVERLVREGGCRRFYMHARKVFTKGLDPSQNRNIPPLNYSMIYRLCEQFPDCEFWLNGGIETLESAVLICYGTKDARRLSFQDNTSDDEAVECRRTLRHGMIPCQLCKCSNGSCIAPPEGKAPPNLRGCMIGRAVMNNPAMMAQADRIFYGESSSPSRSRRHVLQQYCDFLEKRYPRRCCDSNNAITKEYPSPQSNLDPNTFCTICCPADGKEEMTILTNTLTCEIKITSRVVDRAFKPILGLFHGLPGSRTWRKSCNDLARDTKIRNCGPAFALRKATSQMPNDLLDLPF